MSHPALAFLWIAIVTSIFVVAMWSIKKVKRTRRPIRHCQCPKCQKAHRPKEKEIET